MADVPKAQRKVTSGKDKFEEKARERKKKKIPHLAAFSIKKHIHESIINK